MSAESYQHGHWCEDQDHEDGPCKSEWLGVEKEDGTSILVRYVGADYEVSVAKPTPDGHLIELVLPLTYGEAKKIVEAFGMGDL